MALIEDTGISVRGPGEQNSYACAKIWEGRAHFQRVSLGLICFI